MKRNRTSTYSDENPTYFVTTTVIEHSKIFFNNDLCKIVLDNLSFYRDKLGFAIYGYVIMPNHIHLLLQQLGKKTISDFMRDFKKYTSVEIIRYYESRVGFENPTPTTAVPVGFSSPTAEQALGIFEKSARKYMAKRNLEFQVWQERFDDVLIWSERQYNIKLDYIHNNPVRENWNLVSEPQDYKYSSARNYELDDDRIFKIDRLEI